METRRYGEGAVLHLETDTYTRLLQLAATGPGCPGGTGFDPENVLHQLIVEPHSYCCWVHTSVVENGNTGELPPSLLAALREARDSDA